MTALASMWADDGERKSDAIIGSRKLLNALLRFEKGTAKRRYRAGERAWPVRKAKREKTMKLIAVAADHFGYRTGDLIGGRGDKNLSRRRQVAMYVARELIGTSYPDIGHCFHRDHTTVLHACRVVESNVEATLMAAELRGKLT